MLRIPKLLLNHFHSLCFQISMQTLKFSIIIITWNGIRLLKEFLPSVIASEYANFEIIVADNHSDDETVAWVREYAPEVKVVELDRNYGYAGGNNRAAAAATGDILLFLNNDVAVTKKWLAPLSDTFRNGVADIVQPKLRSWRDPDYFEYAGACGGDIDRLGFPFCRGRLFDTVEKDMGQYDQQVPLLWATGAAFAIRREVFLDLGGFDEEVEFHMEEIDLCWRAQKAGYRCTIQPESVVYHLGGGSLAKSNPRKTYYNYRNSLLMLVKNCSGNLFFTLFTRLSMDGISGIRSLLTGKPGETLAILRSHISFYAMLGPALKKREAIRQKQGGQEGEVNSLIYPGLIAVDYFLKGKRTFSSLGFSPGGAGPGYGRISPGRLSDGSNTMNSAASSPPAESDIRHAAGRERTAGSPGGSESGTANTADSRNSRTTQSERTSG